MAKPYVYVKDLTVNPEKYNTNQSLCRNVSLKNYNKIINVIKGWLQGNQERLASPNWEKKSAWEAEVLVCNKITWKYITWCKLMLIRWN